MATAIRLQALPARLGDCLLVECLRPHRSPWRMLVDGGPPDTWPLLEARLGQLPSRARIDVAVVTHLDNDHIGGFLPFVSSPFASRVGDFWFNGRQHLESPREPGRDRSIEQGQTLATVLTGEQGHPTLPWNAAFGGSPIVTAPSPVEVSVPSGGPRVTVLSPDAGHLEALTRSWAAALDSARRGTREIGGPDRPAPLGDLSVLAAQHSPKDDSVPNGSSIGLLVEHRGASVVLAGDGFAPVLTAGLAALRAARGDGTLAVDAVKLPHHGSRCNVTVELLQAAPARHYVFSSNGDTFHHPDDAAVARTVLTAPRGATLWFNYRNERTERWAAPELQRRHEYTARYPARDTDGVVLELPERT